MITDRIVSFHSPTYVQALNGDIANGQYQCNLTSGSDIEIGAPYNTQNISSCSLVNGGFSAGSLSFTFDLDKVYALAGYNGQCQVFYGILDSSPVPPLISDALSVGGRVFIRLGDSGCLGDDTCNATTPRGNCDATLGQASTIEFSPLDFHFVDPDGSGNTILEFDIISGNEDNYFSINTNTGQISLQTPLNRETGSASFNLEVLISDSIYNSTYNVSLFVLDQNDNDPMPTMPDFSASVAEEMPPLTPVLNAVFTDADIGDNAMLVYSLDATETNFIINAETGEIFTNRVFDYEDGDISFTLVVTATDNGAVARSGKVNVTIAIIDENDNHPVITANLAENATFVENGPAVRVADITVNDADANFNLVLATVEVSDAVDIHEFVTVRILPGGIKAGSINSTLYIVGSISPSQMSNILESAVYNNTAEEVTPPLNRTIVYSVCDQFHGSTIPLSLSRDTQNALANATALDPSISATDITILSTACQQFVSSSVILPLKVINDRPILTTFDVVFDPIREDITDEENKGQPVGSVFKNVIRDPDAEGLIGLALVGHGSPATPQSGSAGTSIACNDAYNLCFDSCPDIQSIEVGDSSGQYSIWKCQHLENSFKFWFFKDGTGKSRSCNTDHLESRRRRQTMESGIGNVDLTGVVQVELVLATGYTFNLTSMYLENGAFDFDFSDLDIEHFVAFCRRNGTYVFTYSDGSTVTAPLDAVTIDYNDIGNISETSALVLGPYHLIRFVPHEFEFGIAWLEFKAWDGSDGIIPGTAGVDTTSSASFSLEIGNATIVITAVNNPPEIELGGPGITNYTTVYTENGVPVFITDRNAQIIERDPSNLFLSNLSIAITKEDGSCDLPLYGESLDELFYPNETLVTMITVSMNLSGEACKMYTFSGTLSIDQWNSYIRMIRFGIGNDEPSEHHRRIEFAISDDFSTSLPSFTYIDVALASDNCPTLQLLANSPLIYIEHSSHISLDLSLTVADSDRNPEIQRAIVSITASVQCTYCILYSTISDPTVNVTYSTSTQTLTLDGPATPASFQAVLRGVKFADEGDEPAVNLLTVQFQLIDPMLPSSSCVEATDSISIVIEHVNDNSPIIFLNWPTDQQFHATFTEGDSQIPVTGVPPNNGVMITENDAEHSDSYTVLIHISECISSEDSLEFSSIVLTVSQPYNSDSCSLEMRGSIADLESDLELLRYSNSDIENPTEGVRTINFTILDPGVPATTSFSYITVLAVNDPPEVYLNGLSSDNMVMFQLGENSVPITDAGTIIDHDNTELQSISFSLLEYDSSGAQLSSPSDGVFEKIELDDEGILSTLTLSYIEQTSTQLTLAGTAPIAQYITILNEIVYTNTRIPPSENRREVRVTVSDGEENSAVAIAMISFVGALDPPVVDLNGDEAGRDSTATYTLTTSGVTLFPTGTVTDPNRNQICRLELTMTGNPDTCPPSSIAFTSGGSDIELSEVTSDSTTVFTVTSTLECRNNDIFENILQNIVFQSDGTTGSCTLSVVVQDDSTLRSTAVTSTVEVVAYNDPPYIDLDLGYVGRDYSTVYFQGGQIRHIVSIFNANTSHNISSVTVIGEADGEAATDGLIDGGVVIEEQSDAGYVVRDSDSPSLSYLEAKFTKSSNPDNDVIRYPCKPQDSSVSLDPKGCTLAGESTQITNLECDDNVFEACSADYDLCTGLEVRIFCSTSATKAYRFTYPSSSSSVAQYEALLGYLGYEYLLTDGGNLNQIRLIDISVSDGENTNLRTLTRVRVISLGLTIPTDPPLRFIVYEDERPERIKSVFTLSVQTLDGVIPEVGTVEYRITNGNEDGKFRIDSTTGEIFLQEMVDREEQDEYQLQVTAHLIGTDDDTTATAEVVADIIDINDEPPVVQESFTLNVTEGRANTFVVDVDATDADEGINAELMYLLLGIGVENFNISTDGVVRTSKELNMTEENFYLLVVIVMDMGYPSLSAHTVLHLNVITPPPTNLSFVPETVDSPVSVFESLGVGTLFHRVEAFEVGGTGDTSFIRYAIVSIAPPETEQPFTINNITGDLYVSAALDSERNSLYQIHLSAFSVRSEFFHPSPAEAILEVIVTDINEHAPSFPSAYRFNVGENSANGMLVGTVSATDNDDMNMGVTYSLHPSSPSGLPFDIESDGDIVVSGALDYEDERSFVFTVQAIDDPAHFMAPRTGSTQVTVIVDDRNDNPPVFIGTPYNATVRETASQNTPVLTFNTTDLDSFANSVVSYSSPDIDVSPFCLVTTSIVVCEPFQLTAIEMQTTFTITLVATNLPATSGDITQTASEVVNITLILTNEFEPVFVNDNVSLPGIYEEHCGLGTGATCIGFNVYDFNATDSDGGASGNIAYSLITSGVPFVVDDVTGVLTITGRIDRENQSLYSLQVLAMDEADMDGTVKSAVATISIMILDIDDNPPVIVEPFSFMVTENMTRTTTPFGSVNISDPDITGLHTYLMVIPNQENNHVGCIVLGTGDFLPIAINTDTGDLYFCEPVDFETQPRVYTFTIRIHDTGSLGPNSQPAEYTTDPVMMMVTITDFNDHAPVIERDAYSFSLEEDSGSGTVVGTITATDQDSGAFGDLQFSLLYNGTSQCSATLPFVTVNTSSTTVDIHTCLPIDFEVQEMYIFELVACDSAPIPMCDTASLEVNVLDINDHEPVFTQELYIAEIKETDTSMNETFVVTVIVTDEDSPPNSISTFLILPPGTPFGLRAETALTADVYVMQPSLVDYDAGNSAYTVTVTATNVGAGATFTSITTVYVGITDVNDNAPNISQPYEFSIRENEPDGTIVGCISASDADDGDNSILFYSIVNEFGAVSCLDGTPFRINGSGCLRTCETFDYENIVSYTFTVRVCDNGTSMLCSTRSITVNVTDLNDNPIVYTEDPFFVDVNECAPSNEPVLTITSTDEDSSANSIATFEFLNTTSPFAIRDGRIVYYTGGQTLDYEDGPRAYILHLRGINRPDIAGDTTWTVDVAVVINIIDCNDLPPVFDPEEDSRVIPEHDDSFMYTLTTSDGDTDPNSAVTYNIIGFSPFTIIENTVLISNSTAIDFDPPNNISQYVLTIQAINEPAAPGDVTQTAIFTLTVTVTDINDNAPQCLGPDTFAVRENATVGISVRRYRSTDIDTGVNGVDGLTYDINDGVIGSGDPVCTFDDPFRIYMDTGYIYPCFPLDFERRTSYSINVTVCDGAFPSMCTVCPVEIDILDANDNLPVLNQPTEFSVSETVSANPPTEVGCINGTDADSEENGEIVYTFEESECSMDNPFQINPTTGCISVCHNLDYETDTSYNLTVVLTDSTPPFHSTNGSITIYIENENDNFPTITSLNIAYVNEEEANATVIQVEAVDLDRAPFNSITFSLPDDAGGLFTINTTSGVILTTQPLDREITPLYDVVVNVSDGMLNSQQNMTIFLNDINDNVPIYQGSATYSFLEEDIFELVLLYSDEDSAANSVHSFTVSNSLLSINDMGILTNLGPLDRDPTTGGQPNITIIVTVVDGPNIVETPITIVLLDINDNAPIPLPPFEVDIRDGMVAGTTVITVVATDADAGDNAVLEYGIDGISDTFAIDPVTGNVTLLQNITLDSDMTQDLILTVSIRDNGLNRQTTYHNYTFTIVNLVPRFPQNLYLFSITENDLGDLIDTITAMDRDRDTSNDVFEYMILSVTPYDSGFRITSENDTGYLYSPTNYFDFEDSMEFDLTVAVGRHNMTTVDDETIVRVVVMDSNDNPPRLSPLNILAEVPEDVDNGTTVLTAVGIDFDRGNNGLLSYNHSGLGEEAFEFDSSGNLKVVDSRLIDFELETTFTFNYQACDTGSPQLCSEAGVINIAITNVDDIPPVFNPSEYSITISEDFDLNRVILSVEFGDEDTPLTDVLLSLSPPQTLFEIAQVSGTLMTTNIPLDRETTLIHNFYVVATDTSGQMSSALITIRLSDVNDERPHVEPLQSTASFEEGGEAALIASSLSVVDEDDVSIYPLTHIEVSLHPSPESAESYPLTGGVCDHANYSILYDENVYSMCGFSEPSCVYLLDPASLVVSTGGSLADKVLTTGSGPGFARYTNLFSGADFNTFSVSLWIRLENPSASGSILELRTTVDFEFNLRIDTANDGTGTLTLISRARNTLLATGPLNTHDNQWHHIAVVRDTNFFTIYFDGNEEAHENTSSLFDNSFTTTSFFFGLGLESEYVAEIYICFSNISQEDVQCSLTCGESFDIKNTTDDVTATLDLRTRSLLLEYTGNSNTASQIKLQEALNKVLYVYNNRIEEPHPLSRGVFVEVSDVVGASDERGAISVVAELINDQKPVLDLNGFSEEGIDFATTFEELSDGVLLISDDAVLYDEDSGFSTMARIEVEILLPTTTEELFVSDSVSGLRIIPQSSSRIIIESSSSVERFPGLFLDALRSVKYRDLQDEPVQADRTIQFTVYDMGENFVNSPLATTMVTVVPTNDVPELDLDTLSTATRDTSVIFEEEVGEVKLLSGTSQTISDPDSTLVSQAIIQFVRRPDGSSETLRLDSEGLATSVTQVFDSATGTLILTGTLDLDTWLQILRRVEYVNVYGDPDEDIMRQVSMQVTDDGGGISAPAYINISVVPFNNPSRIFLGGPASEDFNTVFIEDGPCIPIANFTMEIFDVDSETIDFARTTLQTTNVDSRYESIQTIPGGPTGSYITANQYIIFITLDDSSLDNYEQALPTVVYCNTEDEPDEGTREIEVAVRDTGSNLFSAFSFTFIEIQRINDQPTLEVEPLDDISIRGVATPIIDPTSILLEDSDDDRFLALYIFITNDQDGVGNETIIFDTTLPANTTSLGSILTNNGEILNNVTFRGGGADADQVRETISNVRYRNTATNPTVDPPRIICLQVADQSLYFSERVCVNVTISPPNFHSPVITSSISILTYDETAESLMIVTVAATDDDIDLAGQIEFSIPHVLSTPEGGTQQDTTSSGIFEINSTSGVLTAPQGLDAETYTHHIVTVRASDMGNPVESDEIEIEITVTDTNDNAPVFIGGPYILPDVTEAQTAPGQIDEDRIVRAEDSDLDSPNNIVVSYFLSTDDSRFSIDNSGAITYTEVLDADIGDTDIVLTVGAIDSGSPPLTGYTTVSFLIEEINDYEARVEQVSPALFVVENPPRPQSIGPAMRIDDIDLSISSITSVTVKLTVNENDKQRDYATCLAACQSTRIADAGLDDSIDLVAQPDRETIFRTDDGNTDGYQFRQIGDGLCDSVRLTRGATRASDGYGRIARTQFAPEFLSGDFSISFVAKAQSEGFIVIVPDSNNETLPTSDVDRDFAIWLRRRDLRFYYVYGSSSIQETVTYRLPSGEEFFDPTVSLDDAETRHYTVVVSSSSRRVHFYIDCNLVFTGDLNGDVVVPNPSSDVFIGQSRPSPVNGGRLGGELHGLYYHPKELSSEEIIGFCSCGFETLNLPSSIPSSINAEKTTDLNSDVTLSFSPAQSNLIPEDDIVDVLRGILYENTFNPPTFDPLRNLEFTVEEDNNEPTEITSGSIKLVSSDDTLPEIDLSGPVVQGIDYIVEFTEDSGAMSISNDVRVTRDVPEPAVATFNQIEIVLRDGVDADEVLAAASNNPYITVLGSGTTSVIIQGPGDSSDFLSVLATVTYENTNDRPTTNFERTIEFTVTDTKDDVNDPIAITTVHVNAVNDPPQISLSENGADTMHNVEYNEGSPVGVNLAPELSVVDVDNDNLQSAVVILTSPNLARDTLSIEFLPSSLTQEYNTLTGILTLTGPASFSTFEEALRNITFESNDSPFLDNNGNPLSSTDRNVVFRVSDGQVDSEPVTVNIEFQPVDDPPHILGAPNTLDYTEGTAPINIAPMVVLADDDNDQLLSLQVDLQTPLEGDVLSDGTTSSPLLRFDGKSLSEFQNILRQITYVNNADEPILNNRQINIEVCDFTACDRVTVTITVLNANDNTPVFDAMVYTFEVTEDINVGATIDTISVSDGDDRDSFTTSFQYRTEPSALPFRLEQTSASGDEIEIIVNEELDAETVDLYTFVIFASDGDNEGNTTIDITVTNVNEVPSITLETSTATIVGSPSSFTQLLQVGFSITDPDVDDAVLQARLIVRDIPAGSNETLVFLPELNNVSFSAVLDKADEFELELMNGVNQTVLEDALRNIYYAAGSEVTETTIPRAVDITVFDQEGLESDPITVTVSLASIPVFSQSTYNLSLIEGIVHTNFFQLMASVESGGDVINYAVEQGVGVRVDELTGYLSLTELLDRESGTITTFEVFAIDNLPPARTGTATVSITVLDANDVRPTVTVDQNITIYTGIPVLLLPNISVSDPDISSNIIEAIVTAVGETGIVASPFTGELCVDNNAILNKMEQICGLTDYIDVLASQESNLGVTLEQDSFNNLILTNTESGYVNVNTAGLSSLIGTISEVTTAFWFRPEESGYIVYVGRQDPVERYYAIYYDKDANQFIVTLKRVGLTGLQAQVRVIFQVQTPLGDGNWHFVMIQYSNRNLLCAVDAVRVRSEAVSFKEEPFIGQVTGEFNSALFSGQNTHTTLV